MSSYILQILEYIFSTSHNQNEFMHAILLVLLSYIAKTYWDASRVSLKAMQEESNLIYGAHFDENEDKYYQQEPNNFD